MKKVYLYKEQISTQVWQVFVSDEKHYPNAKIDYVVSLCAQHNLS